TEQLLTTITSASADGTATPPRARRSRSMTIESAWFTRQPNVRIEYFMSGAGCSVPGAVPRASPGALTLAPDPWPRPLERLFPDVTARERAVEANRVHACICPRHCVAERRALADDGEHPTAGADDVAARESRAGVKDAHIREGRRLVEPGNRLPARELSRIAARRDDHADALAARSDCPARRKRPRRDRLQQRQQGLAERQQDLRLRIAQPRV